MSETQKADCRDFFLSFFLMKEFNNQTIEVSNKSTHPHMHTHTPHTHTSSTHSLSHSVDVSLKDLINIK